jgi:hypothetical protein
MCETSVLVYVTHLLKIEYVVLYDVSAEFNPQCIMHKFLIM